MAEAPSVLVSCSYAHFLLDWEVVLPFQQQSRLVSFLLSCAYIYRKLKEKNPNLAATNFPDHRGTATSFPLAAFGLSAFVFSTISSLVLKGDTAQFLLLLSVGTTVMILVSSIFLRIVPTRSSYAPLPHHDAEDGSSTSRGVRGSLSVDDRHVYYGADETGTQNRALIPQSQTQARSPRASSSAGIANRNADTDETSSLVSKPTTPRDSEYRNHEAEVPAEMGNGSHYPDVRGLALLSKLEFWQLFLIMGLLSGIGLMTIKLVRPYSSFFFEADC